MAGGSGLLGGAQQNPPIMEKPRQFLDAAGSALGQVFGGQNNPALSEEQNKQAQKQAMLQAGLATILASNGGMVTPNLMSALAQGALAGQQGGAQVRQGMVEQGQQADLRQMIASTPPAQLPQLAQQLVAQGNNDAARVVLEIANANNKPGRAPLEVKVGDETIFIDRDTMQEVARFGPSQEAVAAKRREQEAAANSEREKITFERTDKLADDFRSETSAWQDVAKALGNARGAGHNAVGDQSRIMAMQKLLDPGSVVRGEEFARLGQAGGLTARAQFYWNKLTEEGRLPDNIRRMLEEELNSQAVVSHNQFQNVAERYRSRARAAGVDPSAVVFDPFRGLLGQADTDDRDPFAGG